jgi:hypothetical protein
MDNVEAQAPVEGHQTLLQEPYTETTGRTEAAMIDIDLNARGDYTVYYLPLRKVGLTQDYPGRKRWYRKKYGRDMIIRVLEKLHNVTPQEAGDHEWFWCDKLGLPRHAHYTVTLKAMSSPGSWVVRPSENRAAVMTRVNDSLTADQKRANGQLAFKTVLALGKATFVERGSCPHCGRVTTIANLYRWHYTRCKHRKLITCPTRTEPLITRPTLNRPLITGPGASKQLITRPTH